ncbi:copper/zinc superoxide dismutase family protein [Ichthyophthirius multifiliis]|uniref:Superoxide dismutase [Cu-Zn] n=1 Tax=Ichthyophthirius multifiliis TaxID=5932 RepID=G0QQZ2_ICHMU|nr:copper/zinc superoxide dismutase family protein [Ichthyophthirius multifiliis]EGR32357.1 copper/zinc superoxide dismutase family protein [Ichthyophthirius multifiliis]|eukprot:XP_004035843.1 copper/zinc superoxide dismutase family protein [Ichthyophthirius multifiliis]
MADTAPIYAICILNPDGGSGVSGLVKLVQQGDQVTITATVNGLKTGLHGFHIHQFGNLTEGCKTAGPHFNPFQKTHGGPHDVERHVGDLGNIQAVEGQQAQFSIVDKLIKLDGANSVLGRSFVVHADEDDLGKGGHDDSKTTGHAGARLACGTIGLSGPF